MARAKMRIVFESDSKETSVFEKDVEFTNLREPGGKEFIAQYMLSELATESRWDSYYLALPDVATFSRSVKQTFHLDDFGSGSYEDRINTREMWMEISQTLLRVKVLLAKSRAYHDQELEQSLSQDPEVENLGWHLHLDKMDRFDLATILLGKVSDLAARLVFERLGASLMRNLDRKNPDWERQIIWSNIKQGLADKGNPHVAAIPDAEYKDIQKIFNDFLDTEHGTRLWAYRRRLVHRITPSVDRPELYTQLEDRERIPLVDPAGKQKGWTKGFGGRRAKAEYAFTDLYADATQTFRHYISMLERLNAISRFSPEAEDSGVRATTA